MKYTPEEVMQFVQEEDVKFIRLAFCNVYGKQHNVAIMPAELKRAFPAGDEYYRGTGNVLVPGDLVLQVLGQILLDIYDGVLPFRLPREAAEDVLRLLGAGGGEHIQPEGLEAHDRIAPAQNCYSKH